MRIVNGKRTFELRMLLDKPLFAHLSTSSENGPRESPVWFHWEDEFLWMIGNPGNTFPLRLKEEPKCAIGIVDFDHNTGKVWHAGFRGKATVEPFDQALAERLLSKYLGENKEVWDQRFQHQDEENVLIRFVPETVVVRDQSYGPSISK